MAPADENSSRYHEEYAGWQRDPEAFWARAATAIDWTSPPTRAFDAGLGVYGRWFPDGRCNTCYNALDRHVAAGNGDRQALIHDSAMTGSVQTFTYAALLDEVKALALVLRDMGVGSGDRVLIYMPMVPEAVMAMLACARIGAIHSVVFGGFAAHELSTRIDDAQPKVILAATCGLEPGRVVPYKPLVDGAIELARHKPQSCLILQREQAPAALMSGRDQDWAQAVASAKARGEASPCTDVAATDPLYILYTSGTTGQPKGVVRDNGGHMAALIWSMSAVYDIGPSDVFWAASDVGWVVGHSYIVYAPLLVGATTVMYEGKPVGTPDPGAFWRVIRDHAVKALFTAPTAFRAIKRDDPQARHLADYDISCLQTLFLAGERADPDTLKWAEEALGVPVIDHWWQTETGWAIAANPRGLGLLPLKPGSPAVPMPGYTVEVLDASGVPLPTGQLGAIAIRLPLPPSCLLTLWGSDQRFRDSYLSEFPGYYTTSDAGYVDEDGYLYIMGRTDDIINVAGHRLSTGAMEEVLSGNPAVAECAVIGIADELKGEVPCGFLVLKAGVTADEDDIVNDVVRAVRADIGPVAAFKTALVVARLPKTRSGKILRRTMKAIADGAPWSTPATIDDPAILDEIAQALAARGIGAANTG